MDVQVDIGMLNGKDVTLVFTNETNAEVAMTSVPLSSQAAAPRVNSSMARAAADLHPHMAGKKAIDDFNREGFKEHLRSAKARTHAYTVSSNTATPPPAPAPYAVGDSRAFRYHGGTDHSALLKKQVSLSDGVTLNVWVEKTEDSEAKVSAALVAQLASAFGQAGGIYDLLKETGGPLWSTHTYQDLVSSTAPIDIVIMNFHPDGQPFGEMGYFHAINNFRKTVLANSNESVSLYLDAETLYLGGAKGVQAIKGTMAHEGLHMSNFFRRGIMMGSDYQYDLWLEEMVAMMMEDATGSAVDPTYNTIRDMRYPDYLTYSSYNCALLNFTPFDTACESYSVSGSFGGFLLRQMGMPFFKNLLQQKEVSSEMALQNAIQTLRPQATLGEEMRKFAVGAIAALPASEAPAGFNFPARTDGNYAIPVIDAAQRKAKRVLPTMSPGTIKGLASFPVVRKAVTGRFKETVKVPAGVTLSVVIN
jgi:hypothetical protein